MLPALYREVQKLEPRLLDVKGKDFEYMISWALSNMGRRDRVKKTARAEWRITFAGRAWLDELHEDAL